MLEDATIWTQSAPDSILAEFPGAKFDFSQLVERIPLTSLCDVALRNNPNRRFLFVSRAIGRHLPTDPTKMQEVSRILCSDLLDSLQDVPTIFVGMSETATTLGQSVFREWHQSGREGLYIETTRHRTGGEIAFRFSESHSHATEHVIHLPEETDDPEGWFKKSPQFVVVDDEATTGRTAQALVDAYKKWKGIGPFPSSHLAVILHWNKHLASQKSAIQVSSIVEGRASVEVDYEFPKAPPAQALDGAEVNCRRGVRHGATCPQTLPPEWEKLSAQTDENILVLGSGEFGFQPLLLAESFVSQGARAVLQSTTRSPILPGGAISSVRSFPAFSGKGFVEHLYNVPDDHAYDRVLLCTEAPPPDAAHPIWNIRNIVACPLAE